jgi:hypothetical protein
LSAQDKFNETSPNLVPASKILDTWLDHAWTDGLQVESVEDFTEIHVETRNSIYEITVIDGFSRSVVVRGGRFFTERTPAHLAGSSMGGGFLKIGGIYMGFSLEIVTSDDTLITTHIKSIRVYAPPKSALPG